MTDETKNASETGAFAPLRVRSFRNIWSASLLSNFGQLVLGVAAAWEMTRLTSSPSMVALVQTATMLPLMLVAVPAGAFADMFDRRKVAMIGLGFSMVAAALLAVLAFAGLTTPWMLLGFCFLIGVGVALYAPSWQASIGEQVPPDLLAAAIALGTISYNIARSVGPAVGGLIVIAVGAQGAFALNAVLFLPILIAFYFWRREHTPSRLPPEKFLRAIVSGARFSWHTSNIRTVLIRTFLFGLVSASGTALAPLVAKDMLRGDAATFGILLGAMGFGAIFGGLFVSKVGTKFETERAFQITQVVTGAGLAVMGLSSSLPLTMAAMFVVGASNIISTSLLNVTVQLSAPRWVTARALSFFASCLTGGIAIGAWVWGEVAGLQGVGLALIVSGALSAGAALLGLLAPIKTAQTVAMDTVKLENEPTVAMELSMRSGPIVIEIDYDVDPDLARGFYEVMQRMQQLRQRNGAFNWSLSRDVANPASWTERYQCPTWGDYLRMRDRWTQADLDLQDKANAFDRGPKGDQRVRRRLERPFGSVRWKSDTPDHKRDDIGFMSP